MSAAFRFAWSSWSIPILFSGSCLWTNDVLADARRI